MLGLGARLAHDAGSSPARGTTFTTQIFTPVAQLEEPWISNPMVAGSSPVRGTNSYVRFSLDPFSNPSTKKRRPLPILPYGGFPVGQPSGWPVAPYLPIRSCGSRLAGPGHCRPPGPASLALAVLPGSAPLSLVRTTTAVQALWPPAHALTNLGATPLHVLFTQE